MSLLRLLALSFTPLLVKPALPCFCDYGGPPVREAFHETAAVFIGSPVRVTELSKTRGFAAREHTFRVEMILRGEPAEEFTVGPSLFADCDLGFQIGETYVVYASRFGGRLQTSVCMRTRLLRDAAEDLEYFRSLRNIPER